MVWAGSQMFNGAYGSRLGIASVLGIIYIGVVVSDMVCNSVTDLRSSFHAVQFARQLRWWHCLACG